MDQSGFNFQRFTDVGKSFTPRVTIRQNGQLGFNEGSRNLYKLGDFGYAVLFFDAQRRAVGILRTNDHEEPGAMILRNDPKNTYINAVAFLDRHAIDHSHSRRFELQRTDDDLLFFELSKELSSPGA